MKTLHFHEASILPALNFAPLRNSYDILTAFPKIDHKASFTVFLCRFFFISYLLYVYSIVFFWELNISILELSLTLQIYKVCYFTNEKYYLRDKIWCYIPLHCVKSRWCRKSKISCKSTYLR